MDVVKRLVELIKNSNRYLTTDNYCTRYELVMYCLKNELAFTRTMKKNKVEISQQCYSTIFSLQEEYFFCMCQKKKNVL